MNGLAAGTALFAHRRVLPRTLYVIAPSMALCASTVRDYGFAPGEIEHHRNITRAYHLRGTAPGTPFIALPVALWGTGAEATELAAVMKALQAQGRLRIAQDAELKDYRAVGEWREVAR